MDTPQGKALDLFDAYRANLIAVDKTRVQSDAILCPLDLALIERADVELKRAQLEHIIPQHTTVERAQKTAFTRLAVKDVRSGLTLTCDRCNRKKGSELDSPLRGRIGPGPRKASDYTYRTGTAILTYAYLLAFSAFGYQYIFKKELDEVRKQFEDPDGRHTAWLDYAEVRIDDVEQPIVANEVGYPFQAGLVRGGPLELSFWRFRAKLPGLDGVTTAVEIPASIAASIRSES